jgi:hypothetical protein
MTTDGSELPGFTSIPEPDLMFANGGVDKHPLRGLIEHGPYGARYGTPAVIRFALVAPDANIQQLKRLASELAGNAKTREVPAYYPDYPGFERVFRVPIHHSMSGLSSRFRTSWTTTRVSRTSGRLPALYSNALRSCYPSARTSMWP